MNKEFKHIEDLLLASQASLNNATDQKIWERSLISINNSVRNITYEVEKQIHCELDEEYSNFMDSVNRVNV